MLEINDLSFFYEQQQVLTQLNLKLESQELLSLSGPSGCGKSTLLYSIIGFIKPSSGTITLNEKSLFSHQNHQEIKCEHRNIGIVFQDFSLFPHLNVAKNIDYGISHLHKKEREERRKELLHLAEIEKLEKKFPHELSGGQAQRVAIARALAPQPELLLLDEAFSNLDSQLKLKLITSVRTLLKKLKIPTILITHDEQEAELFGDRKLNFIDINKAISL